MAKGGQKEYDCYLAKYRTLTLNPSELRPHSIAVCGDFLMVTDMTTCKVHLYRCNDGKLLASTNQLDSWPCGICFVNDSEICVALYNGMIAIMSIQNVEDKIEIKRDKILNVDPDLRCNDVARFMDKIIVSGVLQDMLCWCIVSRDDEQIYRVRNICKGQWSYFTTKHNMIYISCYAFIDSPEDTCVYGYDIKKPSKPIYRYKHQDLNKPCGITVDSHGFVFVCNCGYSSIHHLTDKCELVKIYINEIPRDPNVIFWDNKRLYVTSFGSNEVAIYKPNYSHLYGEDGSVERPRLSNWLKHSGFGGSERTLANRHSQGEDGGLERFRLLNRMKHSGFGGSERTLANRHSQGDHKFPAVLASDDRRQPGSEKASNDTEQVNNGQPSVETEMPRSVQVPTCFEEDENDNRYFASLTKAERSGKDRGSEQLKDGWKERGSEIKIELEKKTEDDEKELSTDLSSACHFVISNTENNMDQVVDINLINIMKENIFRRIGEMFRDKRYPAKNAMTYAVKECGYNKGVQCLLKGMSNLLRKKIPHATRVWCGYRLHKPYTPMFVVCLRKHARVPEITSLPKAFHNYDISYRYEHKPNNEETFISELLEGNESTIPEEAERVLRCIARNAGRLMQEHSNLCIITASCVKAIGFNGCYSSLKLKETICIVFYVPVKGIIPIGEKEFPNDIEGIATDVREGEFVFHVGNRAGDKLPKLRMGCCISTKDQQSGTLGGFIDLPGDKIGCITAAHVILGEKERKKYHKFKKETKRTYNVQLTSGKKMIEIYQPSPTNSDAFGKVSQIVFEEGNESAPSVDVAVIEITDDSRIPDAGIFPLDISPDIAEIGLTKEQPIVYTSGKIREHLNSSDSGCVVLKFGSSSGITCGQLVWNGACVRTVNIPGKSWDSVDEKSDPRYFNQWLVKSLGKRKLSKPGDSGALVFICNNGNIRDLEAIGLLVGGTTNHGKGRMYIVTPIKTVFEQLGLRKRSFRSFPDTVQADEIIYSRQILGPEINLFKESHKHLEEQIQEQKETLTMLSEKFAKLDEKLDTKLSEKAREIKDELKTEMKANTTSLEQKMQTVIKDEMKANVIALEERMVGILSRFIEHNHPS